MSQKYQFITIDSILAKFKRDFKGISVQESDAIEWIAEALGHMKSVGASEHVVTFAEVVNYQTDIPVGLHYITQIAKSNKWSGPEDSLCCTSETVEQLEDACADVLSECACNDTESLYNQVPYRPFLDLQYEYLGWVHSKARAEHYSPVTLSDHSFFDTLVCKEPQMEGLYQTCGLGYEYTIAGSKLRFNFESGFVAIAHSRSFTDKHTGYPMIPDDESARAAITYYLGWKLMEQEKWNHREGAAQLAYDAEQRWLKYKKQFSYKTKMPTGVDDHESLMRLGNHLIPPRNRYYGFFGNLGKAEQIPFMNNRRR